MVLLKNREGGCGVLLLPFTTDPNRSFLISSCLSQVTNKIPSDHPPLPSSHSIYRIPPRFSSQTDAMVRGIVTSDDSAKGDSPRLDGDTPASSPPEKPIPYKNNIYQQVHASLGNRPNEPKGDCPSTLRARLRDDIPATSPPDKPIPHKNNVCQQVHTSLGINSNFRDRLRDDTPAKSPSDKPVPDRNNIYQQVHASLGSHLTVPKTTKKVIQKPEKKDPAAQLQGESHTHPADLSNALQIGTPAWDRTFTPP